MRRFLARVVVIATYGYFWTLDYIYAGFWQLLGIVRRGDARVFLTPTGTAKRSPVILIPGIYERWEFMKPIARVLYHEGYPVHVIEGLGYNRGTVEAMANVVSTYVQEHNLRDCVIVAHSKGGLIGKQLLVQYEAQKIFRGMVAISAPFAGSRYAQLFPLRSLRMFIPDAPLLRALAKNDRVNARIVSIYPAFDPHIPGGSHLQGARNIQVQMYGHFRIIKDRRMHREIIKGMNKL